MRNNSLILKSQMLGVLRLDRGRVHPLPPQHLGSDALPETDLGHRSRGAVYKGQLQYFAIFDSLPLDCILDQCIVINVNKHAYYRVVQKNSCMF